MADLIDRQALYEAFESIDWWGRNKHEELVHGAHDESDAFITYKDAIKAIDDAPQINLKPAARTLQGITYDAGHITEVMIRDTDDTMVLFAPQKIAKWISVDDRMPIKTDAYLAVMEGAVPCVVGYNCYTKEWKVLGQYRNQKCRARVTHWMPLPYPPRGENDERSD